MYGFGQLFRQLSNWNIEGIRHFHKCPKTGLSKTFLNEGKFPCIFIQAFGKSVLREADTLSFLNDELPKGMRDFPFHIAKA